MVFFANVILKKSSPHYNIYLPWDLIIEAGLKCEAQKNTLGIHVSQPHELQNLFHKMTPEVIYM